MNLNYEGIKDSLFALVILAIFIYLFKINSCEKLVVKEEVQLNIDSTNYYKAKMKDNIAYTKALEDTVKILHSRSVKTVVKYVTVKQKVKSLEVKLDLTDTNTVNYVAAVDSLESICDSVIVVKDNEIKGLGMVVLAKDTTILNSRKINSLLESDNEILQKELKKSSRRIKILKIERVLYPVVAILAALILSK